MKKSIRNFIFGVFCTCSAFAESSIWDGSADVSWYDKSAKVSFLTTAEQLAGLAQLVNDGVSNFQGKTIVLLNDIFLNPSDSWEHSWIPIGTYQKPFKGTFDGRNSCIYNLYLANQDSARNYIGLFGFAHSATIMNLCLNNGSVPSRGNDYVGGLAGFVTLSKINNVRIDRFSVHGKNYVGCIAGKADYIDSSYCDGAYIKGNKKIGGLVGAGDSVLNSYVKMDWSIEGDSNYVGGIAGLAGIIHNSYAKINVWVEGLDSVGGLAGAGESIAYSYCETRSVLGRSSVGGLVGHGNWIWSSHFKGRNVTGTDSYVGGLVGMGGGIKKSYAIVDDSVRGKNAVGGLIGYHNSSAISESYAETRVVADYGDVGGLVGKSIAYNSGGIKSSYFIGEVLGGYYYYENPLAEKKRFGYIGGLIGFNHDNAHYTIDDSYAIVKLSAYDATHHIGGLAGSAGTIKNSYAIGSIMTNGADSVGGLVGCADTIINSYHVGDPLLKDSVKGGVYVGGLAGVVKGDVISSFNKNTFVEGENYVGSLAGYVNGKIVSSFDINNVVKGDSVVGGLAGFASKIDNSFSRDSISAMYRVGGLAGSVQRIANSYSMSSVMGKEFVGGLVGGGALKIEKSMALGDIYGVTKVGGLSGGVSGIEQSYFDGSITLFDDKSSLVEKYDVGGLVGSGYPHLIEESYMGGSINIAYNIDKEKVVAGCITNDSYYETTVIKNSYYNKDKCAFDIDGNVYKFAEIIESSGLTTEDMQKRSSFEKWNFVDIWEMMDMSYPYLKFYPYSLAKAEISTVSLENIMYNKTEKEPLVTSVFLEGEQLSAGLDYKVIYKNNIDVGTGSIYICGEKPYVGCKKIDFEIKPGIFLITFANDSEILFADSVKYDSLPLYKGDVPAKAATEKYEYAFVGWMPTVGAVTGDANYTAVFDSSLREYSIRFKNGDEELLSYNIPIGSLPEYTESIPTKKSTDKYEYSFVGWNPVISAVMGDATYSAVFDSTLRKYTVSFTNDFMVLQSSELSYGAQPEYLGMEPTRIASSSYTYTFKGWNPAIKTVSGEAIYKAVYDSTLREYTITFKNGDEDLQSIDVAYGTIPEYFGMIPAKVSTNKYDYTFAGWTPAIVSVEGGTCYSAVFDSTLREYTVTFKNGDEDLQSIDVAYETIPEYFGMIPAKASTDKYDYTFVGWTPAVVPVESETSYSAVYDSTLREYTITFKSEGNELQSGNVAYGMVPEYLGVIPIKASTDKYDYSFVGWNPAIVSVEGTAGYSAIFDSTLREYTITFKDEYGVLQQNVVAYGAEPEYIEGTPTKQSTPKYDYNFVGWYPAVTSVSVDAVYTAVYDSSIRSYEVSFVNGIEVLQRDVLDYGSVPTYSGGAPTRAATDSCTYEFAGWNQDLKAVSDNATYTAQFKSTKKTFTIRFKNGPYLLEKKTVAYGEIPEYTGETPVKKTDGTYSYKFAGWSPELGPVTKETDFEADFLAKFDTTKAEGVAEGRIANLEMSVNVVSRNIQFSAAPVGATYALLDLQGRVLQKGRVESANFNIAVPQSGSYLVRINKQTKRVDVK